MQDGRVLGRRRRGALIGVVGIAVSALVLSACSSGGSTSGSATGAGSGGGATTTEAPSAVDIAITPSGSGTIDVTTPIVVKASNGTLKQVTVTNPSKGTTVTGTTSSDGSTWTSNEALGYGVAYQVDAVGADSSGKTKEQKGTVTTLTPSSQVNSNMVPAPSSVSSTGIGVGQPIVFQFVKPVKNRALVQQHLSVTSTAGDKGAWYWVSSSEVHYRGENFWTPNSTITVNASTYGLDFGGGAYGAEDRQETYHVHDAWVAKADGNTSQMQIFDNGNLVNTMPISMGKDATPTHIGTHVISAKNQSVQMNSCSYGVCSGPGSYNETEYWAERMSNDGEFVHENPATVSVQGHANVSHGCINLSEANAMWFFNHLGIGDVVEVSNSGGPVLPLNDTYGDWAVPWSTWSAGNAS
ncbi:MAG TPA: Ig-like domain-containing protein [Pseudonocardiaceae bacterium]|jgi:lipoprotein-anchoring transpeptidase ErfK/SrfK|nr:Ig-like domain-containing protein [Pseudonocardiaceae bacterium]